jgi:preprotein translocase subunit SecG
MFVLSLLLLIIIIIIIIIIIDMLLGNEHSTNLQGYAFHGSCDVYYRARLVVMLEDLRKTAMELRVKEG